MDLADTLNPEHRKVVRRRSIRAKTSLSAIVAVAATIGLLGAASEARAAFILDTGTPTGSSQLVLSTAQSFAAEFNIAAGQTVTDLAAYLEPNTGNATTFEFEVFSNTPAFIGARSPQVLYSATANVSSAPGWDSVTANWTAPTTGSYWLAILEPNVGTTLDVQTEASTNTGTAPALGFAFTGTPGSKYAALNNGVGLQVSTVPIPAAIWLMMSGLGGLGALIRKQKAA